MGAKIVAGEIFTGPIWKVSKDGSVVAIGSILA
jgi:hypothetical protein